MTSANSWGTRTQAHTISQEVLDDIKSTIADIDAGWNGKGALPLTQCINQHDFDSLDAEFNKLNGKGETRSAAGLFGAWQRINKPEMIRARELQWLQDLATFGEHLLNSMLGKPLDHKSNPGEVAAAEEMPTGKAIVFSQLHRKITTVRNALPDILVQSKS